MGNEEFGDYVLQEILGRGGMGEVHRAYDVRRRRIVAVKRLRAEMTRDETYRRRFRTESEVAARLTEPHVLPIHDFGEIDGRLFIDMRLVEGPNLGSLLARQGPLSPADAVDVLEQIAAALDAAHGDDLVHRDVKPQNVLIVTDGPAEAPRFAYLTDFGVAQIGGADTALSSTNTTAGTLDYMAPERFDARRVDHLVDVYSLGCVFYEMLTGDRPFRTTSLTEAMHAHLVSAPPRPSENRADLPLGFDDVVARAMAKDPAERHQTCSALAADARQHLRRVAIAGTADGPAPSPEPEVAQGAVPTEEPVGHEAGAEPDVHESPTADPDVTTEPVVRAPSEPHRPARRRLVLLAGSAAAVVGLGLAVALPSSSDAEAAAPAAGSSASAPASPAPATPTFAAVPATAPAALDATFTGRTSGGEITVALATRNGQVAAYLCDGDSVEAWLEGTVTDRRLRISSPSGAALEATLTDGAAFGTVIVKGQVLPFSGRIAPPPAGLYEARRGSTRIGWIVLSDGEQIGIAKTGDERRPAPALDTAAMSTQVDGTAVPAVAVAPAGPSAWSG